MRSRLPLLVLAAAISAFYLYKLDGVGVLSTDEPRYAAIGNAMARTGDLITPKLWGSPWFEKPPLLYWMTAAGAWAGLNAELAGRLPVVLMSLGFLTASLFLLRHEFGSEAAAIATALVATSAGWMAYSEFCLTDLPLAVFFSLALFLSLPLCRAQPDLRWIHARFATIGACIGLAALTKGLVPIVLALPFFWFLRRFWREWWLAFSACITVALPWYWAVYSRNGYAFIQEFFVKHHFERLYSASLEHVQPWYYYVPILLIGLFPWTPLLGLFVMRQITWDERRRFLVAVVVFGFVFFSVSLNKLPGYLLPLFPSIFALIGAEIELRRMKEISRSWLIPCASLIAAIPLIGRALPESLSAGRFSFSMFERVPPMDIFYVTLPLITIFLARRSWAGPLLILCMAAGGIYLKVEEYPVLDQQVSARGMWTKMKGISDRVCDAGTNRAWIFGLEFYRNAVFPVCGNGKFDFVLQSKGRTAKPELRPTRP